MRLSRSASPSGSSWRRFLPASSTGLVPQLQRIYHSARLSASFKLSITSTKTCARIQHSMPERLQFAPPRQLQLRRESLRKRASQESCHFHSIQPRFETEDG